MLLNLAVKKAGGPAFFTTVRSNGFTLVELVVTLIIVGVLAVSVAPRFSALDDFDSKGFADQTRSILRYAQKVAIAERRQSVVVFSRSSASICSQAHIEAPKDSDCPSSCPSAGFLEVALPGGSFRPGPASISSAAKSVCFNAKGAAYGTTTIDLDGNGITDITVERETGYVR